MITEELRSKIDAVWAGDIAKSLNVLEQLTCCLCVGWGIGLLEESPLGRMGNGSDVTCCLNCPRLEAS